MRSGRRASTTRQVSKPGTFVSGVLNAVVHLHSASKPTVPCVYPFPSEQTLAVLSGGTYRYPWPSPTSRYPTVGCPGVGWFMVNFFFFAHSHPSAWSGLLFSLTPVLADGWALGLKFGGCGHYF